MPCHGLHLQQLEPWDSPGGVFRRERRDVCDVVGNVAVGDGGAVKDDALV